MPLDVVALRDSDFTALATGDEFKAAVLLWCAAWTQIPASSLPDDDRILARLAGCSLGDWKEYREVALRGFILCSDGRLYHPLIADFAAQAFAARKHQARRAQTRWSRVKSGQNATALPPVQKTVPTVRENGTHGNAVVMPEKEIESKSSVSKDTALSGVPFDFDRQAWTAAVALLGAVGRSEKPARAFFGKLLSVNGLEARDLLPAVTAAAVNGTQDPEAYLTKTAASIGRRKLGNGETLRVGFV